MGLFTRVASAFGPAVQRPIPAETAAILADPAFQLWALGARICTKQIAAIVAANTSLDYGVALQRLGDLPPEAALSLTTPEGWELLATQVAAGELTSLAVMVH